MARGSVRAIPTANCPDSAKRARGAKSAKMLVNVCLHTMSGLGQG